MRSFLCDIVITEALCTSSFWERFVTKGRAIPFPCTTFVIKALSYTASRYPRTGRN
jgi:hypothetical protein